MLFILPTEKFHALKNNDVWKSITDLGFNEAYLFEIIFSHIRLNGQVSFDGKIYIPDYFNLEREIEHGNLSYVFDRVRTEYLFADTKLPPKQIVSIICHYTALLFSSIGEILLEMFNSLKLKFKYELLGLRLFNASVEQDGILIDIAHVNHFRGRE
jgi:hypothetical protein